MSIIHTYIAHAFAMKKLFITRALATEINNYGGVSKNLALLFFLVYYSSQVETQGQGMMYILVRCSYTYFRIIM